jgi:dienelactone hydrolase
MRLAALLAVFFAVPALADPKPIEKGKVTFKAVDDQADVAERFRLAPTQFAYELKPKRELPVSGIDIYELTFPSPVKTKYETNNTVYADYYLPKGKGPFPGVIILDILDGSQVVSRGIATVLASHGIAGLCVQMPYYGPRRPPGEKVRLLSADLGQLDQTMEGVRQTVLDNRCAAAWLESRPEIDKKKLGIHGTSLGSFMAALTAAAEPRLNNVSLMLGGGDLVDAYWDHPQVRPQILKAIPPGLAENDAKALAKKLIAPFDPITYADQLKKRNLLMIAASKDDVVPPAAAKALWEATGKQKIVWLNTTHVGAALYLFDATEHIVKHFK